MAQTTINSQNQQPAPPVGLGMLALLIAALLVGAAFNAANPLGVRARAPEPEKLAVAANPPAPAVKPIYQNETVGISVDVDGEGTLPVAAAVPAMPAPAPVVPVAPVLTWPETKALLEAGRIILIDAREAVYYKTEHIPGAISLPASSSKTELQDFAGKFPKNSALVVYCGSAQCPLSNALVGMLREQYGFTNVREMPGGFVEYRQAQANEAKGGPK